MQLLTKRYIVFRGITIGCLQLSTISCRHKKSGNPVKSRLPLQIKEARDGARGPGDLGLRGPERSVDIELSSPGRARKKERYRFGIVLFSSARRGSNYTIVRKPSKYKEKSIPPTKCLQPVYNHILIILIPTHYIALFIFFVL